jgi:hypothetical protein
VDVIEGTPRHAFNAYKNELCDSASSNSPSLSKEGFSFSTGFVTSTN